MGIFEKKASKKDIEELIHTDNGLKADVHNIYDALRSQKKMIDAILEHLKLEPVTTTTVIGAGEVERITTFTLRKKVKKPVKQDTEEYDDA